jgi:hypothetical protein
MVDNLTESPWMCSDSPGSAPIEIPKEGFLSWERAREREKDEGLCGLGKKEDACWLSNPWPWPHLRVARANSPRCTRGQSRRTDSLAPRCERSEITTRASSSSPRLCDPRGQSVGDLRTVPLVRLDGPPVCRGWSEILFLYSLIYFGIKIWIWIFWDHCS